MQTLLYPFQRRVALCTITFSKMLSKVYVTLTIFGSQYSEKKKFLRIQNLGSIWLPTLWRKVQMHRQSSTGAKGGHKMMVKLTLNDL